MSELGLLTQARNDAIAAANRSLDRNLLEAVNRMDARDTMACFLDSPDLVMVLGCNERCGFAAVRDFLTQAFSRTKAVHLKVEDVTHWHSGETAFASGTTICEFENMDGAVTAVKHCWTDARQKVAGRWVYVLLHVSQK